MKKTIIKSARTKDQAIKDALLEINKELNEVSVEILEEESNGFLGLIGQKDALIKITYEEDYKDDLEKIRENLDEEKFIEDVKTPVNYKEDLEKETIDEKLEAKETLSKDDLELDKEEVQKVNIEKYYRAKEFLTELLENMHFENVKVLGDLEDNIIKLDAKIDEKDTGIAIGRAGKTLDSIELILRKSLRVRTNELKINVDINNYKKRRDDKIIEQADHAARKVIKTKKRWNLKYMNSYERRLAHEQISKYKELTSYSEGQEPNRYVVVDFKQS